MCLLLLSTAGFIAKNIAPWLSPHSAKLDILNPISLNKDSLQVIWRAVSLRHIYSASVEESATVFCFLEIQLTAPPASFIIFPVMDFLVIGSLAQSASA